MIAVASLPGPQTQQELKRIDMDYRRSSPGPAVFLYRICIVNNFGI